jgi:hypothetical protein
MVGTEVGSTGGTALVPLHPAARKASTIMTDLRAPNDFCLLGMPASIKKIDDTSK